MNTPKLRSEVRQQADAMAKHGARVLAVMPRYGVFNEAGMPELRKAICDWLGIECPDVFDARGWEEFIRPHVKDL